MMPLADAPAVHLAAYDRKAAYAILRDWTPRTLTSELAAGRFGGRLAPDEAAELEEHLTAWAQRALADMPLRDALLVDGRRGPRVFALLCVELTAARAPIAPELAAALPEALSGDRSLAELGELAAREQLALAVQHGRDDFPFPDDLEALLPPPPRPAPTVEVFEPPTGLRRNLAVLLASLGMLLLLVPLLGGHIPDHPAGLPLALLTAALLVGIRAGWRGYLGALCIWLVANLPGFRHGTDVRALLPALPLMAAGLVLLAFDGRVRALWGWIRRGLRAEG
jgi:hypothetical protein